jgi:hypothetical protein
MVLMYVILSGVKISEYIGNVRAVAVTIVISTVNPMPNDELNFLDTPKNGQIPKNFDRIKFSVKTPAISMIINCSAIPIIITVPF